MACMRSLSVFIFENSMALDRKKSKLSVDNFINNTQINIITILEDKLKNILVEHVGKLKKPKDIMGAVALSLALFSTLLTADFGDLWFPPDTWRGIFIVAFVFSIIYLFNTIVNYLKNRGSVEDILRDIKNEQK